MARKTQHLLLTSWKCLIAHFHRSLLVPQFQVENWLLMCVLGSQDDTAETTLDPTSEQQNCRLGTAASNCAARCLLFMNGIQSQIVRPLHAGPFHNCFVILQLITRYQISFEIAGGMIGVLGHIAPKAVVKDGKARAWLYWEKCDKWPHSFRLQPRQKACHSCPTTQWGHPALSGMLTCNVDICWNVLTCDVDLVDWIFTFFCNRSTVRPFPFPLIHERCDGPSEEPLPCKLHIFFAWDFFCSTHLNALDPSLLWLKD